MKRTAFTFAQAQLIAHQESREALRLNLHRWVKRGDLVAIRRGIYAFPNQPCSFPEMIEVLYPPAYVSLESALNQYGMLPDVPFEQTLITTRATRSFTTPWGRFHFHKIKPQLFFGFDTTTKFAVPEKALLDYFYFRGSHFVQAPDFWQESRLQNLEQIRWKKGEEMAKVYSPKRVKKLWQSLKQYAKTS